MAHHRTKLGAIWGAKGRGTAWHGRGTPCHASHKSLFLFTICSRGNLKPHNAEKDIVYNGLLGDCSLLRQV